MQNVQTSPLRLDRYFFPKVSVTASEEFAASPRTKVTGHLQTDVKVAPLGEGGTAWEVQLTISFKRGSDELPVPYYVELLAVGHFSFQPTEAAPKIEDAPARVQVTGASILFSASREFLLGITARGPFSGFMLPTVSFLPHQVAAAKMPPAKRTTRKARKAS